MSDIYGLWGLGNGLLLFVRYVISVFFLFPAAVYWLRWKVFFRVGCVMVFWFVARDTDVGCL